MDKEDLITHVFIIQVLGPMVLGTLPMLVEHVQLHHSPVVGVVPTTGLLAVGTGDKPHEVPEREPDD